MRKSPTYLESCENPSCSNMVVRSDYYRSKNLRRFCSNTCKFACKKVHFESHNYQYTLSNYQRIPNKQIAADLGVTVDSITAYIVHLRKAGFISPEVKPIFGRKENSDKRKAIVPCEPIPTKVKVIIPKPIKPVKERKLQVTTANHKHPPKKPVKRSETRTISPNDPNYEWIVVDSRTRVQRKKQTA